MQETGDETVHHRRCPFVVLESAVLLDVRWDDLLDGLWVVTAPRDAALHRLIETRGPTLLGGKNAQESRRGIEKHLKRN
jgi:dephospho-CoA kinase